MKETKKIREEDGKQYVWSDEFGQWIPKSEGYITANITFYRLCYRKSIYYRDEFCFEVIPYIVSADKKACEKHAKHFKLDLIDPASDDEGFYIEEKALEFFEDTDGLKAKKIEVKKEAREYAKRQKRYDEIMKSIEDDLDTALNRFLDKNKNNS